MKAFFRVLSLILALTLTILCLPSCGAKEEKVKLTNVFREDTFTLPEEYQNNPDFSINEMYSTNDGVIAMCYLWDEETYESRQFLLPIGLDGSFGEELTFELPEEGNSYINGVKVSSDGTIWVIINSYSFTDEGGYQESMSLRHYQTDGSYETIDLDSLSDPETGETFYINNVETADDGSLVLYSWNGVKVLSPDGKLSDVDLGSATGDVSVEGVLRMNGKLYVQVYYYSADSSSSKLCELDVAGLKLGEEIELRNTNIYNMILGPGYDYYYNDYSAIYGCKFENDERVEVLNFINSDINSNDINTIVPLSPDQFITTGYDNETGAQTIKLLNRVPDDQIIEKEILTLAVPYFYYNMRNAVIKFNKSNDQYRIVVTDYSQYNTDDDYTAGITRLNNDLISGKIPDLLYISGDMAYDHYVAKGLFCDLYELMDADPDFNRGDYLENIFKAYETNGKLYSIIPTFQIQTFAAKTELLEGRTHWTVEEFMEFAKAHPEMQMFDYDFNRDYFMSAIMMFMRDAFIDRDSGKCSFDSEEFKGLLDFASTLTPDDFWSNIDYNEVGPEFWNEYDNRFAENRVLLTQAWIYNIADSYRSLVNYTLKGDATYIGFPCEEGNGATITGTSEFAIAAKSKYKEGAWEFIKSLISEDAQMPVKNSWGGWSYSSGLPILRAAMDKLCEIAMTPPEDKGDGEIVYATTETVVSTDIAIEEPVVDPYSIPMTQEQIDQIMALIEGTTQVARSDEKLNAIILEEAGAYFSGQKSLDETVRIIQNRAEIYVSESR